MNLYIKSARIIDPNSKYHNQIMDIYIENDTIKNIAKNIEISGLVIFKANSSSKILYK